MSSLATTQQRIKNDPIFALLDREALATAPFPSATTDPHARAQHRYHLHGHHHNLFDEGGQKNLAQRSHLDKHSKRQHFIAGKPLCGSASNGLLYGSTPATAPCLSNRHSNNYNDTHVGDLLVNRKNSVGFLYGFEDTKVGKPVSDNRKGKGNFPTWLQDKTSAELKKREIQAKEIEDDIIRHRLQKANEQAKKTVEQRQDLEMLRNYKPWGRPGGGAPRGIENERTSTIRTRQVDCLVDDRSQVLPLGKPGGGAPNRTESGRVVTKIQADNQIRLQAHRDGRPIDSLPQKNDNPYGYRTELDKLAEVSRARRNQEREDNFKKDLETLKYNPYGRPGAGAPLKDEEGSPRTGLPMQLSNDIYELRSKEPKHGHAFTGTDQDNETQALSLRNHRPAAQNKPAKDQRYEDEDDQGFQFGMPGGGAPVRDRNGKVIAHAPRTLIKDRTGAIVKSPTGASKQSEYFPFGKPGAGAPIKDDRGKVNTFVAGRVDHAKLGKLKGNMEETQTKRDYLNTLRSMQEEKELLRNKDRSERMEAAPEVSSWIKRGKVGQPIYDPRTHEIRANPLATSDVTKQRMNIQQQSPNRSRDYHDALEESLRQRDEQRQKELLEQRQKSVEHAKTMESVWGRPGNGAPMYETKRAKVEMNPADYGMKYRDN